MITISSRGSEWHRWDLHFHTPTSFDYLNKSVSNEQIVTGLIEHGIRVVAITDHHAMDIERIADLQRLGTGLLTVLPGIELRSDHGGKPIHYICIFPEDCDLTHVWTTLQGRLGLTSQDIAGKGGDEGVYVPIEEAAAVTRELGGIISIHAGAKSNSIEEISNAEQFQRRIKYDITKKSVDILEIGQLKDIDVHHRIIFPATGLERPLIIGSDNHDMTHYSPKATTWIKACPTFRGLKMLLREPSERSFIGDLPVELAKVQQNKTRFIKRITFKRLPTAPEDQKWFEGSIGLNHGLVAIIGNKGSGKSALADTIGLLGATKNSSGFSFLSDKRFRHARSNYSSHFEAELEWHSSEVVSSGLGDEVPIGNVERVKYLPQDHVEKVCNELSGSGELGFERELKSVIFSHVPSTERLGYGSLDELVKFGTDEKQKQIDNLYKRLRGLSRDRAALERQADPNIRIQLEQQLALKEEELLLFEKEKPQEIAPPVSTPTDEETRLGPLRKAEEEQALVEKDIESCKLRLTENQRKNAVAARINERLANYKKEYEAFLESLESDAAEIGLEPTKLVTLEIRNEGIQQIISDSVIAISLEREKLNPENENGLIKKGAALSLTINQLRAALDAPNRAYQEYLKRVKVWSAKRTVLVGEMNIPESIEGIKASIQSLANIPQSITDLRKQQVFVALQIQQERIGQANVYRNLYGPVQAFIDGHPLAKEKLKLEFRVELCLTGLVERLLGSINMSRKGTFHGKEEGRQTLQSYISKTDWENPESLQEFLFELDDALHNDLRSGTAEPINLGETLVKGKKLEDIYDLIFGLEYIDPRYLLKWEGKDLSMLSPGERGTLLLVFYLLIDKDEVPLIIDQPEGNLDNLTVYQVLVECIKEASKRRQVFVVTHNPNLAVVTDADQVIHASIDKAGGNAITYTCGALEDPRMSRYVTDVLEGTRSAFDARGLKYDVGFNPASLN